jgi:hypothetical protein
MNNFIDDSYLDKLGVIKDGEYRDYISTRVLENLNTRLANRLTELLNDDQLKELLSLPEGRRIMWIENNVPNFESVVKEELDNIVDFIKSVTP